jgi:competence protein ComGC
MNNKQNQKGFALIGLLIVVVIIAILFAMRYKKDKDGNSPAKTGKEAIEQTKKNNQTQLEQQIEIQNTINSIE